VYITSFIVGYHEPLRDQNRTSARLLVFRRRITIASVTRAQEESAQSISIQGTDVRRVDHKYRDICGHDSAGLLVFNVTALRYSIFAVICVDVAMLRRYDSERP
jgi:hypothetical protein